MVKLLHLADIHLDSPFRNAEYSESVKRREDTRRVFADALAFAKKNGVSVVLISGDLFDSEYYTENTVSFLSDAFKSMPECRFVISPGNHDPYKHGSPFALGVFPENVFVFSSEKMQSITFDDLGLTVYGYAFTSVSYTERPLRGFTASGDGFNVLCAHADTEAPLSSYASISAEELSQSGLDYAALGHIHTKKDIRISGKTVYAYSGALTGRDFSEHGENGGILVTLNTVNGKKDVRTERVTFCPWVYKTVTVNLCDVKAEELISTVTKQLSDQALQGREEIIRLILTGSVGYEADTAKLLSALPSFGIKEIQNKTVGEQSYLGLSDDFSIRGELYRTLSPLLNSEDDGQREIAKAALVLGLRALSRTELE